MTTTSHSSTTFCTNRNRTIISPSTVDRNSNNYNIQNKINHFLSGNKSTVNPSPLSVTSRSSFHHFVQEQQVRNNSLDKDVGIVVAGGNAVAGTNMNTMSSRLLSTSAASTIANIDYGFKRTNKHLRSILSHPISLILTSVLNDEKKALSPEFANDTIKNELLRFKGCPYLATILESAVELWKGRSETKLTKKIYSAMGKLIAEGKIEGFRTIEKKNKKSNAKEKSTEDLLFTAETAIPGRGKPDFIISKETNSNGKTQKSIVMMIEFGVGHEFWWKKQDQILLYVEALLQNRNKTSSNKPYTFDEPILLTVITINKHNNAPPATMEVRFGMFLCTRKNSQTDYRISLLWRTESTTRLDASAHFAKVLYAAQMCAYLREQDLTSKSYEYLGPNCCRFDNVVSTFGFAFFRFASNYKLKRKHKTNVYVSSIFEINHALYYPTKVYRSYDNRLRCTERRPNVYVHCPIVKEHYKDILYLADKPDPSDIHPLGNPMPPSYIDKYLESLGKADHEWLWEFKGQLKVIATPYHEGKHYAIRPDQLIPIVDCLEEMHKNGYVHGDIRAYNMVLSYDDDGNNPKGWLIDFDFGGHVKSESPKYPIGYVKNLDDGFRMGEPGEPITFDQDWFALGQIIFGTCYTVSHPGSESVDDIRRRYEIQNDIPREFNTMNGNYSKLQGGVAAFLRDYLREASDAGFELILVKGFNASLNDCNLLQHDRNSPRQDSKGATGSPQKQ